MDRYRYFIFNQKGVLGLGILQVACAGLCVVCGLMDAVFRKDTPLSTTRTPLWGGLIMASPGVLALFASQRKNPVLTTCSLTSRYSALHLILNQYKTRTALWSAVSVMVVASGLSALAAIIISSYSCLTLTYGQEDKEVFHHHNSPEVTFVLHRMVKGANATILLTCAISLVFSSVIGYVGCRSIPLCACYDARTGLESLVPQCEPGDTEMCTLQRGDNRLFNSPAQTHKDDPEDEEGSSNLPPYSRLT